MTGTAATPAKESPCAPAGALPCCLCPCCACHLRQRAGEPVVVQRQLRQLTKGAPAGRQGAANAVVFKAYGLEGQLAEALWTGEHGGAQAVVIHEDCVVLEVVE